MALKKRSLTLRGHRTSISLEEEFWAELNALAMAEGRPLQKLAEDVDKTRQGNLSSALRLYVLAALKGRRL